LATVRVERNAIFPSAQSPGRWPARQMQRFLCLNCHYTVIMQRLIYILTLTILFFSCKKVKVDAGETVEIYLLKSYQTLAGKCQIDPSLSEIQDAAFIKNQDILGYSKTDYQFKLTDHAIEGVKVLRDRVPFAVTVDKQVIYYGFYKPYISSSSCDNSICMDINWTIGNKISLKLGYPGQTQGITIDDQRNNPILIATLKDQGKLK
jgi:hypothetical protein